MDAQTLNILQAAWQWIAAHETAVFVALLGMTYCVWTWVATGSPHLMTSRIWDMFPWRRGCAPGLISDYLAERDQLMRFRAITRLRRVPTLACAHRLVTWMRDNDVDCDEVHQAGIYFDQSLAEFSKRQPTRAHGALFIFLMLVSLLASMYTGAVALQPPAFQVKASKNWYLVDGSSARATSAWLLDRQEPAIRAEQCGSSAATSEVRQDDRDALCSLLRSPDAKALLRAASIAQATLAGGACVMAGLLGLLFARAASRVGLVTRLRGAIALRAAARARDDERRNAIV